MSKRCCNVDGCQKPVRSTNADLCAMHYHRVYRNGTLDKKRIPQPTHMHSNGYVIAHAPGHPLTEGKRPYEFQHRVVFYDTHGTGPFECHWCGVEVGFDTMHIDHHDNDKTNNDPSNLLPSCPNCNMNRPRRERYERFKAIHLAKADGVDPLILQQLNVGTLQ